jgi:hypothetical protein
MFSKFRFRSATFSLVSSRKARITDLLDLELTVTLLEGVILGVVLLEGSLFGVLLFGVVLLEEPRRAGVVTTVAASILFKGKLLAEDSLKQ